MKITINDQDNTITIENNESITSRKTRELLDVLFGSNTPEPEVIEPEVIEPEPVLRMSPTTSGIPLSAQGFRVWLYATPAASTTTLSELAGFDVRSATSINNLALRGPGLANRLGYDRFAVACRFVHDQGYVHQLPTNDSLRTYYRRAVRS